MAFSNPNLFADNASTFEGGTTAWVAGANTTLAISTTELLSGTRSMKATATAAGSVTATSPRFAVTADNWYAVRLPIRKSTATANQVFTGVITWYNASSGGTSLGTSTFSITLGTVTGWQSSNYVVTSGKAPAGALSADVKVTVTNLAAAEFVNFDDIYAAMIPMRTGQLLNFNISSMENDVSGWLVSNGSISRYASSGFNPTPTNGYYVLRAVSTAAGLMDIWLANLVPVTAGTEYIAYALVQSDSAIDVRFNVSWYDSASNFISNIESTTTFTAGMVDRQSLSGVAPAGAAYAKVWVRPVTTAANQVVYVDDVILMPSTKASNNLLTFNEWSHEVLPVPAWTVSSGTSARMYLTSNLTDGFYMLKLTPGTPGMGIMSAQLNRLLPVTPGKTYLVRCVGWRHITDAAQTVSSTMRPRVDWFDSSGNLLSVDNPDQFYPHDASGSFYAQVVSETRTAPTGAAYAKIGVEADCTNTLIDYWAFDNFEFYEATPEYLLSTDSERGMVSLTVNNVYSTADHITIHRVDEDGKKTPLRGYGFVYDNAPYTPGVILVEDYEAPLKSKVWYAITMYQNGAQGNRLFTQTVDSPVLPDADYVWFKSPGIPALNTQVMMEAPLKWSRAARSARYDIVGRKNPMHVSSVRAGRESSITLLIWDQESNELFNSLLDAGLPALIQAMPGYGLDGNLYVSIGDTECEPLDPDAREPGWRWSLSITEIDRPGGGLQGSSGKTWQNIYDAYASWDALFDAWANWTDVLTKG